MKCHYDDLVAPHRCTRTGEYICPEHARLDVVSVSTRVRLPPLPVRKAQAEDYAAIQELAMMYLGKTSVECFDRTYDVLALPALLAINEGQVAGVLSYALDEDCLRIVMLSTRPEHQSRRTARSLLAVAEQEARAQGRLCLAVAISNDDLPALYLYQRWGFVITGIQVGAVLASRGHEDPGFASIPLRDEIHLERRLGS